MALALVAYRGNSPGLTSAPETHHLAVIAKASGIELYRLRNGGGLGLVACAVFKTVGRCLWRLRWVRFPHAPAITAAGGAAVAAEAGDVGVSS